MRRRAVFIPLLAALALIAGSAAASAVPKHPTPVGPDRTVTVMTRNLYFGADLAPVLLAGTPEAFLGAAIGAYEQSLGSDFPARAAAVAREIAANDPALVGLQEVTWWRVGAYGNPAPAEYPLVDFAGAILAELAALGEPYRLAAVVPGFDVELPVPLPDGPVDVRLTVGDALLVRAAPSSVVKVSNVQHGYYGTTFSFLSPIGEVSFPRQWISADVKVRGREFRFITTHLESVAPYFRWAQAGELLAGPGATTLPVVAVGDFNSELDETFALPGGGPVVPDSAGVMLAGGFEDAWSTVHTTDEFTCCFDGDLADPDAELYSRIDLILTRGGFGVTDVRRVGVAPDTGLSVFDRPLYPSDHAGVVADLVLP
jgi:hypothetical protein